MVSSFSVPDLGVFHPPSKRGRSKGQPIAPLTCLSLTDETLFVLGVFGIMHVLVHQFGVFDPLHLFHSAAGVDSHGINIKHTLANVAGTQTTRGEHGASRLHRSRDLPVKGDASAKLGGVLAIVALINALDLVDVCKPTPLYRQNILKSDTSVLIPQ